MRHIAATILLLCICISSAQRLFGTARTNIVPGLLKRQRASCSVQFDSNYTTCPNSSSGECCHTGSGNEQCCPDGSCCPTTDNIIDDTAWYCDPGGGCCWVDPTYSSCPDGFTPASAVPSKAPTPSSKSQSFKNVTVSATDPRITYTPQWDLGSSTCDASQQSKKTVTTNQSLSFNTQGFKVGSGSAIYIDFSQKSASFQILVNGQSENVGVSKNCTYNGPILVSTAAEIKIFVNSFTSKSGFFELNSFLVTEKSSASTATRSAGVRVMGALLLAAVLSV